MQMPYRAVLGLALLGLGMPAAQAASGTLTSFSASASQLTVGGWVDFKAEFSLSAEVPIISGGNSLFEPAPAEGYQEWVINWYSRYVEQVSSLSLQAGGQAHSELLLVPAGSGTTGSWQFSIQFDRAGAHDILIVGNWGGEASSEYGAEVASRNCAYTDPDERSTLWCDSWRYSYPGGVPDSYAIGAAFAPLLIGIEVLQAVPEPQTLALWLLGAAGLAARLRRV